MTGACGGNGAASINDWGDQESRNCDGRTVKGFAWHVNMRGPVPAKPVTQALIAAASTKDSGSGWTSNGMVHWLFPEMERSAEAEPAELLALCVALWLAKSVAKQEGQPSRERHASRSIAEPHGV